MSPIRILIVDDCENWRKQVHLLLEARPGWRIICDASNGLEAIRKTEEIRPDLILLEIGLPDLNGIETARRILPLSPHTKIVFLSLDNSPDVIEVALSTGALGYVYKARACDDLVTAIDAGLRGKHFVSSMLKGYQFSDDALEEWPSSPRGCILF